MKFSHSLKFNSVPEWRAHYINYGALKKLSYALEKEVRTESLNRQGHSTCPRCDRSVGNAIMHTANMRVLDPLSLGPLRPGRHIGHTEAMSRA